MTNNELIKFYEEIVECLIQYGNMDEESAKTLLVSSRIYDIEFEKEDNILFHELPYYWAMVLLHPNDSQWHQDRSLWPPPKDYLDKLRNSK